MLAQYFSNIKLKGDSKFAARFRFLNQALGQILVDWL
jgi:hypothetical protein